MNLANCISVETLHVRPECACVPIKLYRPPRIPLVFEIVEKNENGRRMRRLGIDAEHVLRFMQSYKKEVSSSEICQRCNMERTVVGGIL